MASKPAEDVPGGLYTEYIRGSVYKRPNISRPPHISVPHTADLKYTAAKRPNT